jgi:hypothetical protein
MTDAVRTLADEFRHVLTAEHFEIALEFARAWAV